MNLIDKTDVEILEVIARQLELGRMSPQFIVELRRIAFNHEKMIEWVNRIRTTAKKVAPDMWKEVGRMKGLEDEQE